MKHLLLGFLILLTSCATSVVRTTPIDAYITTDDAPTYFNTRPTSRATGYHFTKNQQVHVVKRHDPGWLIFLYQGKEVYIVSSYISPTRIEEAQSTQSNSYPGSPSYRSSGSHDIQTGPRGGQYYINSNGNKTYIKHK